MRWQSNILLEKKESFLLERLIPDLSKYKIRNVRKQLNFVDKKSRNLYTLDIVIKNPGTRLREIGIIYFPLPFCTSYTIYFANKNFMINSLALSDASYFSKIYRIAKGTNEIKNYEIELLKKILEFIGGKS